MAEKKKKNEDIFNATELTPLAVEYKRLIEKGDHDKAHEILEKIIIGSTQMFTRLAQFEGYHRTVDVDRLVSAAQQKVIKWLDKWNIKRGPLFSFFSKPIAGDSLVTMANGSKKRIDEIVNNKLPVEVLSWNEKTRQMQPKRVTGWYRRPAEKWEWRKLSAIILPGYYSALYLTEDHPVRTTMNGYVEAAQLDPSVDQIYYQSPVVTQAGRSAIIGIYLGDGCVSRQSYSLSFSHGKNQYAYSEHLGSKFQKNIWVGNATVKGKTYEHISKVCVPLRQLWRECYKKFSHDKKVDQWLLEQIDEVALAYWYMDDGSRGVSCGALHCCSFSREDSEKLAVLLRDKFGVDCKYRARPHGRYGDIFFTADGAKNFQAIVAPYLLPLFDYKLSPELRLLPKKDVGPFVSHGMAPVNFQIRPVIGKSNVKYSGHDGSNGRRWFVPDWKWKYCIEVEDNHNFFAEGILVRNCSKFAFLSEVSKENQFRTRYHVTSDNLESIFGMEDHPSMKEEAEELDKVFQKIYVRWGSEQEQNAIRYLLACIKDHDSHDKNAAIKGCAYAWGLSFEMSKFFYNWCFMELRHLLYKKIRIPFTQQDLFRHANSYTHLVDLLDIITWDQFVKLTIVMGGTRLKIPTSVQMAKLASDYKIAMAIEDSDMDPETVGEIAKTQKRSVKTAEQAYRDHIDNTNVDRAGEHELYPKE